MAAKNITGNGAAGNGVTDNENAGNGAAAVTGGARPSGAAGDVWDALTGNPGATVTALAEVSGVSRATVARTLTALEGDGRAARTRGGRDGGKRLPDTWHPVTATTADDTPATDHMPDASAQDAPTGDADTATDTPVSTDAPTADDTAPGPDAPTEAPATDQDTTDAPTGTDTAPTGDAGATEPTDAGDPGAGMDAAAVAEARDALTALQDAVGAALAALDAGDGAGALSAAEGAYSGSGLVRRLVRAAANGRPRTASGAPRSAPGEMRAKVAAHLTGHRGAAFTPHEIAKVIGHSAGAVSNALDRLTEAGEAELVCERPRRFTATTGRRAGRAAR